MKRINGLRVLLVVFSLMIAVLAPRSEAWPAGVPAALAEEAQMLRISLSAQPDALVEPGDITLVLNIENISDLDAHNVYLSSSDGLLSEPIGQLSAGKSQTLTRTHSVSQAELEEGRITYIISHDDPLEEGHKINYSVQAGILKSDLLPQVEFTRQFSSRYVAPGDTVTITYRITNTGNVALTALRVQDTLGDFTGRVERLDVGESRTLISRVTMHEADSSSASLNYEVEAMDNAGFVSVLAEAPVRMAYGQIDASLSAQYSAFSTDTADVVLLLTNLGNVEYSNIRITDDIYGGVIAENVILPSGSADPIEISCKYPVRGDEGFRWRITGISEAGEKVDLLTETVTLKRPGVAYPTEVTLETQAYTPNIRRAGMVPVHVRIDNSGDADAANINLYERTRGLLHSFLILPAGDSIERDVYVKIDESCELNFTLSYKDIYGHDQGVIAAPVNVTISADGVLPADAEEESSFAGSSVKIGGTSLFIVLLITGSSVLLVLIVILLIFSRKARIEKQLRIAVERQRRKGENGKGAGRTAAAGKGVAGKAGVSPRKAKK